MASEAAKEWVNDTLIRLPESACGSPLRMAQMAEDAFDAGSAAAEKRLMERLERVCEERIEREGFPKNRSVVAVLAARAAIESLLARMKAPETGDGETNDRD